MKLLETTKKIMIVDDDRNFLKFLQETLETKGFAVCSLSQHKLIDEYIQNFKPDLILLDIKLDDDDGRLICNGLKARSVTEHIPIILITGLSYNEISKIDCNADAILGKPFSVLNLFRTITDLL